MNNEPTDQQTMSPEAQRIAIAEACGQDWALICRYHSTIADKYFPEKITLKSCPWCGEETEWINLPDYLDDLNAMHEAEKVLTRAQQFTYADWLRELNPDEKAFNWQCPALQRAEAFLRTLGLWQPDTQPKGAE